MAGSGGAPGILGKLLSAVFNVNRQEGSLDQCRERYRARFTLSHARYRSRRRRDGENSSHGAAHAVSSQNQMLVEPQRGRSANSLSASIQQECLPRE
jgi:hypothetical protein